MRLGSRGLPHWMLFGAAAAAGAALVVLALLSLNSYKRSADTTTDAAQVYASEAGLYVDLLAAESNERAYILLGDDAFLEKYQQAAQRIPAALDDLDRRTASRPAQRGLMTTLRETVAQRMAVLDEAVELARQGQRDQAASIVAEGEGTAQMNRILETLVGIVTIEGQRHTQARDLADRRAMQTTVAVVALALVTAALLGWVYLSLRRRGVEDALRRSNEAKDEFLGMVSHELRTPLMVLLGNVKILNRDGRGFTAEVRSESLREMEREGDRLLQIVENMLTLSRVERGAALDLEPVATRHFVLDAAARHRRRFPGRAVDVVAPADLPPLLAHEGYLTQVIDNLLVNAEKYGDERAPIEIAAASDGKTVEISVSNAGQSIDLVQRQRIFEPFVRVGASAAKKDGVGLGLPVCLKLVEVQDGRLWMSDREGGGSTFTFCLSAVAADELDEALEGQSVPAR